MAKNRKNADTETVVNYASPGSVVGIQCGSSISGSTVTVNGSTTTNGGGRWVDIEDMDRSLISNPDD